jgi:hypothetical protein
MAAMAQASPIPRKTFTAFDPVTLPIEESAVLSWIAAVFEANVSGRLVPIATTEKKNKKNVVYKKYLLN